MNNSKPKRIPTVRTAKIRNTTVLVKQQKAYELNDVAAEIWRLSDGNNTVTDIADILSESYDAETQVILSDCIETLLSLVEMEVLEIID